MEEPSAAERFGPHIIVFVDDSGEVQVATQGRQFHPEEITKMFAVATAKIELMGFQMMLQQMAAQQQKQASPLLVARRNVGDLSL